MKILSISKIKTTYSGAQTIYQNLFHMVFSTKYRRRVLSPLVKLKIRSWMRLQEELLGMKIIIMNGYLDHLHILVSIPPKVSISEVAHGIKGYSSRMLGKNFYWQRGYYVKAISRMEFIDSFFYIRNQYFHHKVDEHSLENEIELFDNIDSRAA